MTQSSIEWYVREIKILNDYYGVRSITYEEYKEQKHELLKQAKKMHKQEIIDATLYGWRRSTEVNAILPNEFYNETFQNK